MSDVKPLPYHVGRLRQAVDEETAVFVKNEGHDSTFAWVDVVEEVRRVDAVGTGVETEPEVAVCTIPPEQDCNYILGQLDDGNARKDPVRGDGKGWHQRRFYIGPLRRLPIN